ncbi:MAG: hypothetical protein AB7T27_11590 [Kiritimatiellia bacterium]
MKRTSPALIALAAFCLLCAPAGARDPALVKQQYDAVKANLNDGGDLMIIANVDGLLESGIQKIIDFAGLAAKNEPSAAAAAEVLNKLPAFLRANGFYAVRGLGFSSVPASSSLNTIRGFISRDPAAAALPLWRGLFGMQGMDMITPAYLPADTEIVRTFACEPAQLWQIVRQGVTTLGTPENAAAFEQSLAMSTVMLGLSLDSLINTLGGEGFMSLQMSPSKTVDIPVGAGGAPISIPEPSFLFGITVKDSSLANLLKTRFCGPGLPATLAETNGSEIITMNAPLPLPFPAQITIASRSNILLIGSTPGVIGRSLAAAKSGNGLLASAKFKSAFGTLPMKNNGLIYFSPEAAKNIQKIQEAALAADASADAEMSRALMKFFGNDEPQQAAMVIVNTKNGILLSGRTSFGGREMLASTALAPIAMMAGVAMPAIVQARSNSQKNSCINNLRQIEGAKDQWAIDNGATVGDQVSPSDIEPYLKEFPSCPSGGSYVLNPIGTPATCDQPGHALE